MIRATVMYPHAAGKRFDFDYYTQKHLPMVGQLLGGVLKGASAERGVSGAGPGTEPAFAAIAQMTFESFEALQAALGTHGPALMGDIPNFTDIQPVIQVSEVLL